jgi:hypothetical protein
MAQPSEPDEPGPNHLNCLKNCRVNRHFKRHEPPVVTET